MLYSSKKKLSKSCVPKQSKEHKDIKKSLICAVQEGSLDRVRNLIDSYGLGWLGGYPLLCDAINYKYTDIAKYLLSTGARFDRINNEKIKYTESPLHLAIKKDETEIVKMILDKGGHLNDENENGENPLHYAINKQKIEITKLLIKCGADINATGSLGIAPLLSSIMSGNLKLVELLINNGADINSCMCEEKKYAYTPLYYAIELNKKDIFTLLLSKGVDVNSRSIDGSTALHVACRTGNAKFVGALLEYNANVHLGDNKGNTPLHVSANEDYSDICLMLLNKGANVNAKRKDGNTSLHLASTEEVVKVLLDSGAKCDLKNYNNGEIPLHKRVRKGCAAVVEMMLKSGADVNIKFCNGMTALHVASRREHLDTVHILLKYGADINVAVNGRSALDYCKQSLIRSSAGDYYNEFETTTAGHLLRHIVKLKAAKLYLNTNLFPDRHDYYGLRDFHGTCECEIARLKTDKISNTIVSLYDVLAKGTNSLAIYMENENILQVLQSGEYKTKYPLYSSMIECNFRKGMKRKEAIEFSIPIIHHLFTISLPYTCVVKIYSYLDNEDLKNLLEVI